MESWRKDDAELPPQFLQIAAARSMGALTRAMEQGSRLRGRRDSRLAIGLFEHGGVVGTLVNQQPFHFRYDEVERFTQHAVRTTYNGIPGTTDIVCFLKLFDGRTQRVTGANNRFHRSIVDDFREVVDPRIAAAQLPRMLAGLQQGQSVDFGDLMVEPGGLLLASGFLRKQKRLPWADVSDVVIRNGAVNVMARGKRSAWGSVGVPDVPNLTAFTALVRAARNG